MKAMISTRALAAALASVAILGAPAAKALTVYAVGLYPDAFNEVTFETTADTPSGFLSQAPGYFSAPAGGPFLDVVGPIGLTTTGPVNPADPGLPDLFAFCVDMLHGVPAGNGEQVNVPGSSIEYTSQTLNTDFAGDSLTQSQSFEIQFLVNSGSRYAALHTFSISPDGHEYDMLGAFQVAIWDIEYNLTQSSAADMPNAYDPSRMFGDVQALLNKAQTLALTHTTGYGTVVTSGANGSQSLASSAPTPEPATWVMMLVGIGAVGGVMRSRRRAVTA